MTSNNISNIIQEKVGCEVQFEISKRERSGFWLDISKLKNKILYEPTSFDVGLNFILPNIKVL